MGKVMYKSVGGLLAAPAALPTGYTKLAYIQSSGTQYVDSLFTPNQDTRIVYDCERLSASSAEHFFGVRTGNSAVKAFAFYIYNSGWRSIYNTTQTNGDDPSSGRYLIDMNKNITKVNANLTLSATYGTFTSDGSALLFAMRSTPNGIGYGSHKLYSCQIYDNGTLVRDFVPCINASNAVGLYDLVNGQFYGNAGTGVFTGGEA